MIFWSKIELLNCSSNSNVDVRCKFKNNCDENALCTVNSTNHKYICKCLDGYIGNGFKCYGIKINYKTKKNWLYFL